MATNHHQAWIEHVAAVCQSDARIAAAFIGGSRGAGTADDYADIDLYLILRDDAYDDFFAQRRTFMRRPGDPVLLEDFNGFGFDMLLFIYADGIEGELVLARESGFAHIPSGPFMALLDRDGILPPNGFPPMKQPAEPEQQEHLRWMVHWFWRDLSQFSRWMARGRLWSAYGHLEMLRHTCLGLVRLKHAFVPALGSYDNLELAADEQDLAAFQPTFCTVERGAIMEAVRTLLEIYLHVAPPLAAARGITYPAKLHDTVIRRLEEACAISFDVPAGAWLVKNGDDGE